MSANISVASVNMLKLSDISCKIAVLHGELCKEPLMPKNFKFYNPDEHKEIMPYQSNRVRHNTTFGTFHPTISYLLPPGIAKIHLLESTG